jgi:hypothetical protein
MADTLQGGNHLLAQSTGADTFTAGVIPPSPATHASTHHGHARLLIRVIHFLLYFVVALSIVMLSGRRYLARDRRMAAFIGALVLLLSAGHALRSTWSWYW